MARAAWGHFVTMPLTPARTLGAARAFRDKAAMTTTALDDAHLATRSVTRLSVGVAVVLIALKAFALGASGSVAIMASLTDSALDLVASLATFFAVRWAAAPPDAEHRHGHGKGEAMAALVQSGLIFASALFIGWEAVQRIFDPRPVSSGYWAVTVVLISIALTGWLVWMQDRAIRRSGSMAVKADRAHYVADLAASGVVLIGAASGSFLAAPGLDAAAGLIVAVWLFWGALVLLKEAADHLLDRAVPDADRIAITTAVLADPRISGVHQLRSRMVGPVMSVQMHVDLEPSLTLEQAHAIVVEAENRLLEAFPRADILIHADPRGRAGVHPEAGEEPGETA
ncbi:cation diffusion facilitator family transporter [Roseibacterium beibuensis]|uniref:cation diffusion facilitator family transporter n=1 Tax=[Roseibacterium] beibuensis TaxID=1193142 RepID=UPI00217EEAE0|nr:cation diffusion facilitator family transporter [Roseibacterium beibuensis]MCS6624739.1 cation diffusion facilitator family transporter [Roseibacterium beibuensis]